MILATAHNYLKKHDLESESRVSQTRTKVPQLLTNFSDFNTHHAHIMQHYYLNASRTPNILLFEIVCKQLQYLALKMAGPL